MGKRKKDKKKETKPWCFYCARKFDDEATLVQHQKAKHFKCPYCHKKMGSVSGLATHVLQVHKENLLKVPNAKEGRDSIEYDIFGMEGIPEEFLEEEEGADTTKKTKQEHEYSALAPPVIPGMPVVPPYGVPPAYPPYGAYPPPMPGVPPIMGMGAYPPPVPPPYGQVPPYGQLPYTGPRFGFNAAFNQPPGMPPFVPPPMYGQPPVPPVPGAQPYQPAPPVPPTTTSPAPSTATTTTTPAAGVPVSPAQTTTTPTTAATPEAKAVQPQLTSPAAAPAAPAAGATAQPAAGLKVILVYDDENFSMEEKRAMLDKYRYDADKITSEVSKLDKAIESRLSSMFSASSAPADSH